MTGARICSCLAFVMSFFPVALAAQDTRTVTEPRVPAACVTLKAQLTARDGTLAAADESKPDTTRIQAAIDQCGPGKAVALRPDGAHDAFLTGPLELKSGITLLVDAGATLFGSRNPRDYDRRPGSCGVIGESNGCKPLIYAGAAPNSAIMGSGVIDGRGGAKLLGQKLSWWELADLARNGGRHSCPRMLVAEHSDNFILYGITFRNAPFFHVSVGETNGFTAWGVKIDSPPDSRNTDGIDPFSSTNVTITNSYFRSGDNSVAIKAGDRGPASHTTISHSHFYEGAGVAIGSETNGGVSSIMVSDVTIDGAKMGIRIKSDISRGGVVSGVTYEDVCIRDTKYPINIDSFYDHEAKGNAIPSFRDIVLRDVHIAGGGQVQILGFDAQHPITAIFDNVISDGLRPDHVRAAHAQIGTGPGPVNFALRGEDIRVQSISGQKRPPKNCKNAFVPFPDGPPLTVLKAQSIQH